MIGTKTRCLTIAILTILGPLASWAQSGSTPLSTGTLNFSYNLDIGSCGYDDFYYYDFYSVSYTDVNGQTGPAFPIDLRYDDSTGSSCDMWGAEPPFSTYFTGTDSNGNGYKITVYPNDGWMDGTYEAQGSLIDGGNLQNSNSWNYCVSASCSQVAPSYFLWPLGHVSSPSTTGSSLETYQYGPAYWGILYYYSHSFNSQEVNATNFKVQWQYYVDSSSYIQALEFDFPVIYNNLAFYFGSQCVQGANWQYWNPNNKTWNDFSPEVPCTQTSASTWHTLVWNGTRTTSGFTYQTLEIDGQQYNVNTSLAAPSNTTGIANNTITVQFQPDGNYVNPNPGYHEYVDNVQAWIW